MWNTALPLPTPSWKIFHCQLQKFNFIYFSPFVSTSLRCWGVVSIGQWPLSMASGWLWQPEADQCHCHPRKIQQLRLGDPVPHALQWHREELETLSSRREYLGESLWEGKDTEWSYRCLTPDPPALVQPGDGERTWLWLVGGWPRWIFFFLSLCFLCSLLNEKEMWAEHKSWGMWTHTPVCPTPYHAV